MVRKCVEDEEEEEERGGEATARVQRKEQDLRRKIRRSEKRKK